MATDYVKEYADVLMPFIAKKFGLGARSIVLDVGCGDGSYVRALWGWGVVASGVDPLPGSCMSTGSADSLPYPDCTFDFVYSKSVLEHLEYPEDALQEMYRVTKPGGTCANIVPDWAWCFRWFYAAWDHVRPFCGQGLVEMMERAGFHNVKVERLIPSVLIFKHPRWRWLLAAVARVVPYRWLGKLRFAAPRHYMLLAHGEKGK